MKSFTSFFQLFAFVVLCFSTTISHAQSVQLLPGSVITTHDYETAAADGAGNVSLVAFQKPSSQIRLASYFTSSTGSVDLKNILDLGNAKQANLVMLSSTRAVLVQILTDNKLKVTVFDIGLGNGSIYQKGSWTGPIVNNIKPAIVKRSVSSFAVGVSIGAGNFRLTTFTVDPNSNIYKKDDDDNIGAIQSIELGFIYPDRYVAGVRIGNDKLKVVCFNVLGDQVITQISSHQWIGSFKKVSLAKRWGAYFVVFSTDSNNRLDAKSFQVNDAGSFVIKDEKNDIKRPSTNSYYQLLEIVGQQHTGSNKMLLSAVRSDFYQAVIPFNITNDGIIQVQGGDYNTAVQYNHTCSAKLEDKMFTVSRQMNGKYKLSAYTW